MQFILVEGKYTGINGNNCEECSTTSCIDCKTAYGTCIKCDSSKEYLYDNKCYSDCPTSPSIYLFNN